VSEIIAKKGLKPSTDFIGGIIRAEKAAYYVASGVVVSYFAPIGG